MFDFIDSAGGGAGVGRTPLVFCSISEECSVQMDDDLINLVMSIFTDIPLIIHVLTHIYFFSSMSTVKYV